MAPRGLKLQSVTTIHKGMRGALVFTVGVIVLGAALWSGLTERAGMALYDAQMRWQAAGSSEQSATVREGAAADAPTGTGVGGAGGASVAGSAGGAATAAARNNNIRAPIVLVTIDQSSLDWVQKELGLGWPWPRELYGVMANYLRGARVQAWDILFTEVSTYGPEDDARCAKAMSEAGNVALATLVDKPPVFDAANLELGHVAADVDSDGICRKYRMWIDLAGRRLPALGLAALNVAARNESTRSAAFGANANNEKWLKFLSRSDFTRYSAAQIIAAAAPGGNMAHTLDLAGEIVVVGITAPGLMDRQATPIDPALPGMEVHATFIADALAGTFMSRTPIWIELLAAIAVSFAVSVFPLFRKKGAAAVGIALAFAIPVGASIWLFPHLTFFNPILAEVASLASFVAAMGLGYRSEGRQRAYLRRAFAQYLSPEVIATLVESPGTLKLGGESRVISVLFSDLEGFTSISERLGPEQLAQFMNEYLDIISAEILEQGGTLDKYVGDAVVAFWNAPLEIEDHAARALAAAAHVQKKLADASPRFQARYGVVPHTRIGVATGKAVVGNLGSSVRFAYTAVGDSVNIASRLEAANKATGTLVLVMGETVAAASPKSAIPAASATPVPAASMTAAASATAAASMPAATSEEAAISVPMATPVPATPPSPSLTLSLAGGETLRLKKLGSALVQGKTYPVELWTIELDLSGAGLPLKLPEPWDDIRRISK